VYKAQSQDEEALVNGASRLHISLISKNSNTAGIDHSRSSSTLCFSMKLLLKKII
jgi:hypothetical protein